MTAARTAGRPPTEPARTVYLINRVRGLLHGRLEEALRPLDITPTQYLVLSVLLNRRDLSSADLSRRFKVKPQSMIKLISQLETKRLIVRERSVQSRRILQAAVTEDGKCLLRACDAVVDRLESQLFARYSAAELALLRELLVRLLEPIDKPG